ncbi:MAG: hypothetical protein ACLQVI_35255 [Polyangiaceae bacterium]
MGGIRSFSTDTARALSLLVAVAAIAAVSATVVACGGTSSATSLHDAAAGDDAAAPVLDAGDASLPTDAASPPDAIAPDTGLPPADDAGPLVLPLVINFDGGTLAAPKLIAVTFPGDDQATQIATFTQAIGASAYWKAVTSEYGVGPAVGATILETEAAPTAINQNDGDSETWLSTRFDGTHPEWGTFDPTAVYIVFYPSTTVATPSVGGCGGAYHDAIPITIAAVDGGDGGAGASAQMIYGIVFRCATSPDVGRPSGVDLTTFMASHEMVEASTDPFGTAYAQTDLDHIAWAYFFGSEVGDMCAFHAGAAITPSEIGFAVQRTWSNAAAAAFEDPCVPGESSPLFLAAPVGETSITMTSSVGGPVATQGFPLPNGQSITIGIRFYGSATGTWTVTPFTYTMEHGQPEPYLQFSSATLTGQSGDVVPLTIKRIAEDTDGNGGDAVKLVSTQGSQTNEWYFAVTN